MSIRRCAFVSVSVGLAACWALGCSKGSSSASKLDASTRSQPAATGDASTPDAATGVSPAGTRDAAVDASADAGPSAKLPGTSSVDAGSVPGLPITQGWTVLTASSDTRTIYVSAAGNDAWDGLAPDFVSGTSGPKLTLNAGRALLRDGSPDWLMLRRGDKFTGGFGGWNRSGRSVTEPMVISSYGSATARPVVSGGLGLAGSSVVSHLSIVGVAFEGTGNADQGVSGVTGNDLLVEDCYAHNFAGSVVFDGHSSAQGFTAVRVRRSVFDTSQDNMFFFSGIKGLLIEENVLINASVANNHAMYITRAGNENVITRGNLVLYAGHKNGIMQRPGGLSEGNVVVGATWGAITMGQCNDDGGPSFAPCWPAVSVTIRGNLATEGIAGQGGFTIDPTYVVSGAVIEDNIVTHIAAGPTYNAAFTVGGDHATIQRNILNDAAASVQQGQNQLWQDNSFFSTLPGVLIYADNLSSPGSAGVSAKNNRFYSTGAAANAWFMLGNPKGFADWKNATGETGSAASFSYTDPSRTIATYSQSLGLAATRDAFFAEAGKQSKQNYRPEYTAAAVIAYFRAGF